MPASVQEVYDELWDDVSTVHFRFQLYIGELFGTQESVDLLNRFAPNLFEQLFDVMLDHVLLRLAHLTDPLRVLQQPEEGQSEPSPAHGSDRAELAWPDGDDRPPGSYGRPQRTLRRDAGVEEPAAGPQGLGASCRTPSECQPTPDQGGTGEGGAYHEHPVSMHYRDIEVRFDNIFEMGTGEGLIQHLGDLARRLDIEEEQWRR